MPSQALKETFKSGLSFLMLPISKGPLKGKKWIVSCGTNFILGRYEVQNIDTVLNLVNEGDVVYDVGAHVGYYTALFSMKVGKTGNVFAFEPRGINLKFLKKHIEANHFDNVRIMETCVGETTGEVTFETRTGTGTGSISSSGNITVPVVSLDDLVMNQGTTPPNLIKMDVEGAEMMVLKGASQTVAAYHPTFVIATHSKDLFTQCHDFLTAHGYQVNAIDQPSGDKEIYATFSH